MAKSKAKKDEGEKAPKVAKRPALADVLAKIRKEEPTTIRHPGEPIGGTLYPTRFLGLNALLGGGLRGGAIIEPHGFEDAAKTSFSLACAADVQARAPEGKKLVVLVNYELPEDYKWWATLGLQGCYPKEDQTLFVQLRPASLEQGIGRLVEILDTGTVCCVVLDSIYAAAARARKQMLLKWASADPKKAKGAALGVEAVKWGEAWTSLKGMFTDLDVVCIAVNQMREKIDVGGRPQKGYMPKPTTTPRGHALKFYAWVRLRMEGWGFDPKVRPGQDGKRVRISVVKNKTSADAKGRVEYDLIRGVGWDMTSDLIQLSLDSGAVTGGGGGIYTLGSKKIKGKEALVKLIEGEPRLQVALRSRVEKWLAERVASGGEASNGEDEGEEDAPDSEE